jgi:negative regulator of sigma E activity
MNHRSSQPVQIEPLPAEFPQSLRDVDALFARQARQVSVPAGLADRMFMASRPALIAATTHAQSGPPRLRLVPAPQPLHQSSWARLAMAACVVLACVFAFWALQPSRQHSNEQLAGVNDSLAGSSGDLLAAASEVPHTASASHYEASLSYLIESQNLSIDDLDDLKTELAMFVARF